MKDKMIIMKDCDGIPGREWRERKRKNERFVFNAGSASLQTSGCFTMIAFAEIAKWMSHVEASLSDLTPTLRAGCGL